MIAGNDTSLKKHSKYFSCAASILIAGTRGLCAKINAK